MKKLILPLAMTLLASQAMGQGWTAASATVIHGINSTLGLTPLSVGIGTSSPSTQLHTTGGVRFAGLINDNTLTRIVASDQNGNLAWRDASTLIPNAWLTTGNFLTNPAVNYIGTNDNNALSIRANNVEFMRVNTANATTGIGTVEVGQPAAFNGSISLSSRDVTGFSFPFIINGNIPAGSTWAATTGATNTLGRMLRFNQINGGTTNLYDIGVGQSGEFFISDRSPVTPAMPMKMITIATNDRVGINMPWGTLPSADFHTIGSVRHQGLVAGAGTPLVADALGNVFLGNGTIATTSCTTTNLVPKVNSAAGDLACSQIFDNGTSVGINTTGGFGYTFPGGPTWVTGSTVPSGSGNVRLDVNGVVRGLAYAATSDERYKRDIEAITDPMKIIKGLKGKTYYWNDLARQETHADGNKQYGFIAQEVAKVFPEAAIQDQQGHYALYYNSFIPVLTEAIKQQQQQIEELKQIIEQLKGTPVTGVQVPASEEARLDQNAPNPFGNVTVIKFYIPQGVTKAAIAILDLNGKQLKNYPVAERGEGSVTIESGNMNAGIYLYSLLIDGREAQTKRMVLSR